MEMQFKTSEIKINAPITQSTSSILTPDALRFLSFLHQKFEPRRQILLQARTTKSVEYDAGLLPQFKRTVYDDPNWKCAPIPNDVKRRRVEITGPVDRKMVINGLNSTADVYMADFEDSTSPTWSNLVEGQVNLRDAVRGTISYKNPKTGRVYELKEEEERSVLMVRPRGWHLDEGHVTIDGRVMSGSLFDFGLYFYHNVHTLLRNNTGPYFYLPKLEGSTEAKLWNDVFVSSQSYLGLPTGTIRATVLLETITAAFEMEEILYELRDHSLGLNCGRWDYLFSYIKKFKSHGDKIAPDRSHLTMDAPLMVSYVRRLIYVCHSRKTFAMGGMAAAIPIKDDPVKNGEAMGRIEGDKLREVRAGHDGTWVAHPALVEVARRVFDQNMSGDNQIENNPGLIGKGVTEGELLELPVVPHGEAITSVGLRRGICIVLAYVEAWLRGVGCIPLNHHMEDAATAEISRVQIWQWRVHGVVTQDDGVLVSGERIREEIWGEVGRHGKAGRWLLAGKLVEDMLNKEKLDDFLTTVCYPHILENCFTNSSGKCNL